ncbi:MAG: N-6 DNA methylase, partial [candidate division Zixibacteria bacterium]|nr:N-6 DNA methylase [candidate division Zixibacteria bacterium]
MKGKIKGKLTKISSPYDATTHKTERSAVAILMHWMRGIIENKNLDLGMPDVETTGADRKMPDTVIYESRRSQNVLCVVEAKQPFFDVYDETLKDEARKKANKRNAKYFATTNFKKLIWWKTQEANNPAIPEPRRIVDTYNLSEIENLDDIEQTRYGEPIKNNLEEFLTRLYAVYSGREAEPRKPIDELLIFNLHEKVRVLSLYYRRIIDDKCHKETSFAKKLKNWFMEQGWSFAWQTQDFDKAARQTAYLLVNKILFYNALQTKRPQELEPLEIPVSLFKGESLQTELQKYFNQVLKIDYETIYTTDFIDTVAFPEAKEVVKEIKELVSLLKEYDFSNLGFDVIGGIFERLIPQEERHNLGQYFTRADVVDLILRFCFEHEDNKILDPGCGAGTFLVRAYQHKKLMNQRLGHEKILESLWGNDISKFPATLATINLAINDLGVDKNYPNIIQEDFFAIMSHPERGFELPDKWRKVRAKTLGVEEREVTFPRLFDAVVGNPPYTRQEEIPDIGVDKEKLIERALKDPSGRKMAEIGKRAGIHAYFFVHGTKFLSEGGHFGFIVSNSWLDVDYGKGLQEFFLKNYKIITIIESKVERWFEEADINTCIIILQKCSKKKERDENLVRFVYLKKPLRHFIPPAQDMWEKQIKRLNSIDELKKTILAHNDFYENEELRIFPKSQKELWEEGLEDVVEGFSLPKSGSLKTSATEPKYVGSKWGKYLRAPEIFFKILEKGKGKLVPLKQIAKVRFGIKTGANEFFYLTEEEIKRKGIEKEFWMHKTKKGKWAPNYVITSPRECKSIVVNQKDLKFRVLMIHKNKERLENTKVLEYIDAGERKKFHKRPTCENRERWYDLGYQTPPDGVWFKAFNDRFLAPLNIWQVSSSDRFYAIYLKNKVLKSRLFLYLNSTLPVLVVELFGRVNLGEGALDNMTYETASMFVLDVRKEYASDGRKFIDIFNRPIEDIFTELGASSAEEVSLDKVKPDRRELDKIIMGEILGLTDEEQLEVYKAVVDLVKSRIEKAKSVGKNSKI